MLHALVFRVIRVSEVPSGYVDRPLFAPKVWSRRGRNQVSRMWLNLTGLDVFGMFVEAECCWQGFLKEWMWCESISG